MALKDKVITLLSLWITILLSIAFMVENAWMRLMLVVVASGVTIHLLRINTYQPESQRESTDSVFEFD